MRIIRPEASWRILRPGWAGESERLQGLALKCGYRICEICEELGCSERYLYSVFTRDIGLPPKEWLRLERMVVARRMLVGGRLPEVVAERLGFASAASFRREFLAFYQLPPLDFQQERWQVGGRVMNIEH